MPLPLPLPSLPPPLCTPRRRQPAGCSATPVRKSGWKSKDELTAAIAAQGWQFRHIKVDGGCYEVYGTSPKGQRVEAYFHPVTLELLLIARRGEILYRK